jgi:DNA-binding GntR family transcriptional regulator
MLKHLNPSAAENIANHLRSQILSGNLIPGERIKQEQVAKECQTSRIPVRDALTQLNNEGLVALTIHSGARVAALSAVELDELYLLRECLEPQALAASVPELPLSTVETLEECMLEMEQVADPEDPSRWVELDRRLHLTSYSAAALPEFLRLIEGIWNRSQQYRRAYVRLPRSFETAQMEHRLLVGAIRAGDATQASTIIGMHIRRTRLALREHSQLFEWQE